MADEDIGSAPAEKTPAPSIEETMGAAYDKANAPDPAASTSAPQAEGVPSAEAAVTAEQPATTDSRARGPDGKFIKAEPDTPPEAAQAAPGPKIEAATTAETTTQTAPTAPRAWNAKGRDLYVKADPALRDYIAQRESEMERGVKQVTERYTALEQVIGPRRNILAASYGSPEAAIQQLFALSDFAESDAAGFIKYFAQQRGINLQTLTVQPGEQTPPEIAALNTKLSTIEQRLQQEEQTRLQQAQQALQGQIETFRLATNGDGTSSHPHFDDVRADMAALMNAGRAESLDQAYEMAIYANPTVRAQVLASTKVKEEEQRQKDAAARAAEARRVAGTNLSARGAVSGSPVKGKTIEETLGAVYDRIQGAA